MSTDDKRGTKERVFLSDLLIYPIKSAAGIPVKTAGLTARGLKGDRRYMLVSPTGKFITQRRFPKLSLVCPTLTSVATASDVPSLKVTAPDMDDLFIDPANLQHQVEMSQNLLDVEVWGDRVSAISLGPTIANWFTDFLSTPCQLVCMAEHSDRPTDHGKFGPAEQVSFADAYPYLLITTASLTGLNEKLAAKQVAPVPMNRFRPNLVISGDSAPHAEDHWKQIRIGSATFTVAKPCARCSIPNVNQATGDRTREPSITLATYRAWDKEIWFGQNLLQERPAGSDTLGQLTIGDSVEILA
ncbi:MAG: MOSC N-terminal beta barrel domain-containing protein [Cyanobacteria bacterium J06626_6]